jgi:hypothetical protein
MNYDFRFQNQNLLIIPRANLFPGWMIDEMVVVQVIARLKVFRQRVCIDFKRFILFGELLLSATGLRPTAKSELKFATASNSGCPFLWFDFS